jgi:hypothetical protein
MSMFSTFFEPQASSSQLIEGLPGTLDDVDTTPPILYTIQTLLLKISEVVGLGRAARVVS